MRCEQLYCGLHTTMRIIAIRHGLLNKVTRAPSNCSFPQKCEIHPHNARYKHATQITTAIGKIKFNRLQVQAPFIFWCINR